MYILDRFYKDIKTIYLKNKQKFDPFLHTVVSFDLIQFFPNINVTRVITHIIDEIYNNRNIYFKEGQDEQGNKIKFLPKNISFKKHVKLWCLWCCLYFNI